MELAKIEKLLEVYLEGNTTLVEEQELARFFNEEEVPAHLESFGMMFRSFDVARTETLSKEVIFPKKKKNRFWNYSLAASFLILIGIVGFMMSQPRLTTEEELALAKYNEAKKAMLMVSEGLNKGTQTMAHLDNFEKGASTISVLNQFNESKNLIFK